MNGLDELEFKEDEQEQEDARLEEE